MCPARLPPPHYCVWGENRLSNCGNLELGLPGNMPLLPLEGNPDPSASPKVFLPQDPSSFIRAMSARRTRILEADHLRWFFLVWMPLLCNVNTLSRSFLICKMGYSYVLVRVDAKMKDGIHGAWSRVDTHFSSFTLSFSPLVFSHLGLSLFQCPITFCFLTLAHKSA